MKEIKAFIRPEKLNFVAQNLKKEHFCCFTVFEGEGVGDYADPDTEFPSLNFPFLHNKVVKIELVCDKKNVDNIVQTIREHAKTGHSGDGLIYVSNVESKIRIRDGE
ncbi:MAG: P-II family nitrogen regulator [Lutibacter sp.]|jgi:nitrogen regulatory protein P-II 1|uniref:P-II family nitrogen regulator n=1 Tax=Lutibacter sp. TaxID=1925666 RepID=UPI00299F0F5B|nr:P-II family nitrogen regulator [Lutibacter sp.]MDX1828843.1 P-II family nitrogen regulator [Lutibacter sp.]